MDTLTAMRSFVRVVETGSFSAVAREENTTQSTISKRVAILESNLGTQLLVRGGRLHSLTEAGQNYYERVVGILRDLEEAESEARSLIATPRGKLRVSVPVMFGTLYIAPVIPEFLSAFPEVQLDLKFSEKMVNLVEEGIDVAIRLGDLKDSSMIARHLGDDDLIIVASPTYLEKHSIPQNPSELITHNCLVYSLGASGNTWTFSGQHSDTTVQVSGNFQGDSGCGLMEMLLADAGVSFMPSWLVSPYVQSGQLVHILQDYYKSYPINAVYPLNRNVPLKTKSFMDFIQQKLNQNPIL